MNPSIITSYTYICPVCAYRQDFDPYTGDRHSTVFSEYLGMRAGYCPSCFGGQSSAGVSVVTMLERISDNSSVHVADDSELMERLVPVMDERNMPVMEHVGTQYEQHFFPSTGKTDIIEVPIMRPTLRAMTRNELDIMKIQRDQDIDRIEQSAA